MPTLKIQAKECTRILAAHAAAVVGVDNSEELVEDLQVLAQITQSPDDFASLRCF